MPDKKDMLKRFAKAFEDNEIKLPDNSMWFKDIVNRPDLRCEIKMPELSFDDTTDPIDKGVIMRVEKIVSSVVSPTEDPPPELIKKMREQLEDEIYVSLKCGSDVPAVTIDELRDAINDKDNPRKMNRLMIQNNRWLNQRWSERSAIKIEHDYEPYLRWRWRL